MIRLDMRFHRRRFCIISVVRKFGAPARSVEHAVHRCTLQLFESLRREQLLCHAVAEASFCPPGDAAGSVRDGAMPTVSLEGDGALECHGVLWISWWSVARPCHTSSSRLPPWSPSVCMWSDRRVPPGPKEWSRGAAADARRRGAAPTGWGVASARGETDA
jgi:hypothetical protein